jgi:hypothetical protein
MLLVPGLTLVMLLENESGFEIVTQIRTSENDRFHVYSLYSDVTFMKLSYSLVVFQNFRL